MTNIRNKNMILKLVIFNIICILLFSNNINAIEINCKEKVQVNEQVTVNIDLGTYIAAYDRLQVIYNNEVLEYVSGDDLKQDVWWDTTEESIGINSKTYTFKALKEGISVIKISIEGAISANENMDYIGDIEAYTIITVGEDYIKGDINGDKKVNSIDASIILDKYKYDNATEEDLVLADMNNDGKLNAQDASIIFDIYKNT